MLDSNGKDVHLTRRTLACAWTAMAGLAMAGASGQVLAQPAQRTLVINISLEPDSLDPTSAPAASIGEVVHYNVLEGLTRIEESGAPSPLLAQASARPTTASPSTKGPASSHAGASTSCRFASA